ncbi:Sensor histidine kinase RcsC [Methylobacterium tardum]|uniref:histidine kinase n=2 Tax=Methylobacterium tardum TaxID=374432 RepID=A0AA37TGQ4_9HYPH|nr:Sensor histidine kinase RcsC [Methylobacterium tardum]GLS71707.1 hypothetical protein GCM10007890_37200 [Methylobacterium tardum]
MDEALDLPVAGAAERLLRWLTAAALALPILIFTTASWIAYGNAFSEAHERLHRTLDLMHEHAAKVLETHDLVVEQIDQLTRGLSDADVRAREPDLHARLAKIVRRLPQVSNIWVLDAIGHPLVGSIASPPPQALDLSDRDYVRAHRDGTTPRGQAYIGEVLVGRVFGRRNFQISTAREEGQGGFAGVVAVSASPSYFHDFYGDVVQGGGITTASLMRADGTVLARYPALPDDVTRRSAHGPMMRAIAQSPGRGLVKGRSDLDGVERINAYRRLPGYPIYVTVGIDRAVVIHGWLMLMASHLIFGIPATLGLVALSLVALRRTRREAMAMAALHAEAARRQDMEAQLRQAQKMEAIGRLTGGIAHDFNNLLQIILGSLDLLGRRMANGDERQRRLIENAREGATRAANLTQRLLAFSRRQPLEPKPLDANKIVSGLSELLRRTLPETIQIETVLGGGLWRTHVDAGQLENALLNLAVNARDAMPEGGRLTIETANAHLDEAYAASRVEVTAGQYVLVAVTDTGTGMSPEVMRNAFEPFFTTKEQGKGTGLGLSQVYGFIKQSGGHIALYSEAGQGTTVKLYLPRYTGTEEITEPHAAAPVQADGKTAVLVVEDEEGVRRFAVEALREIGYRVLEASGAAVALRLLADHPEVALLLSDVVMPEMDGRRLADAALKLRPDLKVVFMTGYTRNAIVHNGVLDAGTHLIGKPFTLPQLATKLDAVLKGSGA